MEDNKKVAEFLTESTAVEDSLSNVNNIKNSLDKIGMGALLGDSLIALKNLKENKDKFIEDNK